MSSSDSFSLVQMNRDWHAWVRGKRSQKCVRVSSNVLVSRSFDGGVSLVITIFCCCYFALNGNQIIVEGGYVRMFKEQGRKYKYVYIYFLKKGPMLHYRGPHSLTLSPPLSPIFISSCEETSPCSFFVSHLHKSVFSSDEQSCRKHFCGHEICYLRKKWSLMWPLTLQGLIPPAFLVVFLDRAAGLSNSINVVLGWLWMNQSQANLSSAFWQNGKSPEVNQKTVELHNISLVKHTQNRF